MLLTILQIFSVIPHIASEEFIFEYFSQIEPFGCHDNQSNSMVWTKSICLVDHSTNISKKHFCQNICNEIAINASFHFFPFISLWKFKVAIATNVLKLFKYFGCYGNFNKNNIFIEANIINNSAKFQLYQH